MEGSGVNDIYQAVMWETARVGGLLAYVLASASVCLGLLLSLKVRSPRWPRFVTDGLHRHVTIVGLVFTAVHTLGVWLDPFTAFAPAEVFVPFAAHYRPLWIGLGVVAAYLMVAVYLSEKIRPHIGYQWWRRFHFLSFGVFVLGTLHGIGSGSDTATWWAIGIYAICVGSVVGLLTWRLWVALAPDDRAPSLSLLGVATVALAAWTFLLPMQPGWNAIANNGNGNGQANAAETLPRSTDRTVQPGTLPRTITQQPADGEHARRDGADADHDSDHHSDDGDDSDEHQAEHI
jgi:sulfoxide reductase heme-binding subunit YedZ